MYKIQICKIYLSSCTSLVTLIKLLILKRLIVRITFVDIINFLMFLTFYCYFSDVEKIISRKEKWELQTTVQTTTTLVISSGSGDLVCLAYDWSSLTLTDDLLCSNLDCITLELNFGRTDAQTFDGIEISFASFIVLCNNINLNSVGNVTHYL